MAQITVEAIRFKDVRGNDLNYVKITNQLTKQEVLISIGEKNIAALEKLLTEAPTPTRIENGEPEAKLQSQEQLKAKTKSNL